MALLLLGLGFGWPLMWATISTEGTDSFDALSRSYAYVFQRPLRYLFYVLVAGRPRLARLAAGRDFAAAVICAQLLGRRLGKRRIGCGIEIQGGTPAWSGMSHAGSRIIHFWVVCVKSLAVGYFYGYFWTASSAIYLLLRRDVDATETDEVFLDADKSEPEHGLPPLGTDQAEGPRGGDASAKANGDPRGRRGMKGEGMRSGLELRLDRANAKVRNRKRTGTRR